MMRSAGGVLALAIAALFACCSADPHQEEDVAGNDHGLGNRFDSAGHQTRALDSFGGGNLVRDVRDLRHSGYVPYLISRRFDLASLYGGKREPWSLAPVEYVGYYGDGLPKRNFDEIDRSGLDTFVKKRNFDEIDRSSMPFPYTTKRFDIIRPGNNNIRGSTNSNYDVKRSLPEHPMDEIDLSLFPIGSQRSMPMYPRVQHLLY